MSRKLILLLCLCALPVLAFSQAAVSANTPIGAHLPSGLNGEVYGGLQWESFDLHNFLGLPGTSSVPRQSLVGFHASTSVALSRWLATEGEISRSSNNYKALFVAGDQLATSSLTFMAGPRVTYHLGSLAQFAHILIGVDRLDATYTPPSGSSGKASSNPFTFAIGGGTSFHVSQRFGLATTVDYIRPSTSGIALNNIRITVGPVFYFGGSKPEVAHYTPAPIPVPKPTRSIQQVPVRAPACIEYMIDAQGNEWCMLHSGPQ